MKKRRKHTTLNMKPLEWVLVIIFVIMAMLNLVIFQSHPTIYEVVKIDDANQTKTIQYYHQYYEAKQRFDKIIKEGNENPAILYDGKIINIRYGIVNFKTKDIQENTPFTMNESNQIGYTNGNYGADALFLGLSNDTKQVFFLLSGVKGWVSRQDVEILSIHDPSIQSTSYYTYENHYLYHHISTDLKMNPSATIQLGKPSFTPTTDKLYSYDGHYFYTSYKKMTDDIRIGTYHHADNPDTPYYNYYQYLSHRSLSQYRSNDIDAYIQNELHYSSKPSTYPAKVQQSLLYDEGDAFIKYQNKYGANAIMMLALAMNESGYGRSQLAIEKNNLFSHAAYDIDPSGNATGYKTPSASIHAHAKVYLSDGYLDPCDQSLSVDDAKRCQSTNGNRYFGGAFGDKSGGMNVRYASDPYWGEKAASYYQAFDETMGFHDYQRKQLGMIDGRKRWKVFGKPDSSSSLLYYTPDASTYSVVLLKKVKGNFYQGSDEWYQIQSDAHLNDSKTKILRDQGIYQAKHDTAYIPAMAIEEVVSK